MRREKLLPLEVYILVGTTEMKRHHGSVPRAPAGLETAPRALTCGAAGPWLRWAVSVGGHSLVLERGVMPRKRAKMDCRCFFHLTVLIPLMLPIRSSDRITYQFNSCLNPHHNPTYLSFPALFSLRNLTDIHGVNCYLHVYVSKFAFLTQNYLFSSVWIKQRS